MSDLVHDPSTHFLGKRDAKKPHAMLAEFVDFEKADATLDVPANIINSSLTDGGPAGAVQLAMYLNDREGDCTCAGIGNKLRTDSNDAEEVTDDDVQAVYVGVTGEEGAAYDPATGANDNGCAEIDVLDWVTQKGIGGVKILGHAYVNPTNDKQRRIALYLCGALYDGIQLSTDNQSQQIWEPGPAAAGSWGGHCVVTCDEYTEITPGLTIGGVPIPSDIPGGFAFAVETWGGYKPCAGTYIPFAFDELHAVLTQQWLDKVKADPTLSQIINVAAIEAYFQSLQQES